MTHIDRRILFTALTFLAVSMKGRDETDLAELVLQLASLIEAFVAKHIPNYAEA